MRLSVLDAMAWRPRTNFHLSKFMLKGFYWLIILGSFVEGDGSKEIESRAFGGPTTRHRHRALPLQIRKHRNSAPILVPPPPPPKSFSHVTMGKDNGDLTSAAQTLYDLRGYHIPLSGAEETQHFLRNQNIAQQPQQQPLRQSPLVFPSFFQPQNSPSQQHFYNVQGNQQHQDVSDFGHVKAGSRLLAPNPTNFRPSQPDLGQSTTEDTFKPFNPPGLADPLKHEPLSTNQDQEQRPYIYVYDDADYDVEVSREPIPANQNQGRKAKVKEHSIPSSTLPPQTAIPHPGQVQYEFYSADRDAPPESFGRPNNNIPFSGFVDDHAQGTFIPGHHFTSGPNVEIIPSSERKPPPDAPNTIPAKLKVRPAKEEVYEEFTVRPPFELNSELKQSKPNQVPEEVDYSRRQEPSLVVEHTPEQELYDQPFHFEPAPPLMPISTNGRQKPNSLGHKRQRQQSARPVEIVPHAGDNAEEYDPVLIQKLNPYIHPDPFNPPEQLRNNNVRNIPANGRNNAAENFAETYADNEENVFAEQEIPTTTTVRTTTSTTREPPTSRSTLRPRGRSHFPPFPGRSTTTTASTTSTTTTAAPRRMTRPRLRTTEAPTQAPAAETDFYVNDHQQLNVENHNSIEQEQPQEEQQQVTRNQESVFNMQIRNRNRPRTEFRAPQPTQSQNRVRGHGHVRGQIQNGGSQEPRPSTQPVTFRDNRGRDTRVRDNGHNLEARKPSPTPVLTVDQNIYEETPSLQVKTRTRPNSPRSQNQRPSNFNPVPIPVREEPSTPAIHPTQGREVQYIPEFAPFPEEPRQEQIVKQIPRGRKQPLPPLPPPQPTQTQNRVHHYHHQRHGGKPLYVTGKMLEKEGGLYAGYEVLPQHHVYGSGMPLPIIVIPSIPPTVPFFEAPLPTRQQYSEQHQGQLRHRERPPVRQPSYQQENHQQQQQQQRNRAQLQQSPQPQNQQSEFRRPPAIPPTPFTQHRSEPLNNAISTAASDVDSPIPKSRARIRLMDPATRRRKAKAENLQETVQNLQEETVGPSRSPDSIVNSEAISNLRYQPTPITYLQGLPPTPTPFTPPVRETSAPSLEIELPATSKPNPLKGRPLKRIRVPGPITTTPAALPAEEPTATQTAGRKLRPRPRFMRPLPKQEVREIEPIATTGVTQSVRAPFKPSQAPAKFSSRYKEEGNLSAPPPTVPEVVDIEESPPHAQSQFSLPPSPPVVIKTRPVVKIKKKPRPTAQPPVFTPPAIPSVQPLIVREVLTAASTLPTSILLSPKDVIQNRKPARRIPPGSASDRLKALTERRRKLFKTRVGPVAATAQEQDSEQDYDGEDQEPYASNIEQVQSKREVRFVAGNGRNSSRNSLTLLRKNVPGSDEKVSLEGTTKAPPVAALNKSHTVEGTVPSRTEFRLVWEAVGSTTPEPQYSYWNQLRGDRGQLVKNDTVKGIPVPVIDFDSNVNDDDNPLATSSESPFNVFRLSNQQPTLPIEAEFFQRFSSPASSSPSRPVRRERKS